MLTHFQRLHPHLPTPSQPISPSLSFLRRCGAWRGGVITAYLTLTDEGWAGWGVNGLSDSVRALNTANGTLSLTGLLYIAPNRRTSAHRHIYTCSLCSLLSLTRQSFFILQVLQLMTEGRSVKGVSTCSVRIKISVFVCVHRWWAGVCASVCLMAWAVLWNRTESDAGLLLRNGWIERKGRLLWKKLWMQFPIFAFLSEDREKEGAQREWEWVGDWINYVLSPFSWLKSTLLPLDSLCLCLRRRQMDRACHPVQALPSLSESWTFRSARQACFVSWYLLLWSVFLSFFLSFFLSQSIKKWVLGPAVHYSHNELWEQFQVF